MWTVLICLCATLAAGTSVQLEELLEEVGGKQEVINTGGHQEVKRNVLYNATVHDTYKCFYVNGSRTVRAEPSVKSICKVAHNKLRRKHGVPVLKWHDDIEAEAKAYAEYLAANDKFDHSSTAYGENLGKVSISFDDIVSPSCIIKNWYNELTNWNFDTSTRVPNTVTGHFTQVVWSATRRLGCGMASSRVNGMTKTVLVCQYKPKGNIVGQYAANVLRPAEIREYTQGELDWTGKCDFTKCKLKYCPILKSVCCDTCNS